MQCLQIMTYYLSTARSACGFEPWHYFSVIHYLSQMEISTVGGPKHSYHLYTDDTPLPLMHAHMQQALGSDSAH